MENQRDFVKMKLKRMFNFCEGTFVVMLLFSIVLIPFSFAIVDSPNVNSEPGNYSAAFYFIPSPDVG